MTADGLKSVCVCFLVAIVTVLFVGKSLEFTVISLLWSCFMEPAFEMYRGLREMHVFIMI